VSPRVGLVQGNTTAFGGAPVNAARHVEMVADFVDAVPIWLETGPDVVAHGNGWRVRGIDERQVADRLIALARGQKLQGLHLYGAFGYPLAAVAAARFLCLPLIVSLRGSDINLGLYGGATMLEAASAATVMTVLSPFPEKLVRRLFPPHGPVITVPIMVNESDFSGGVARVPLERPIIGCVAEFRRISGLDVLLDAFQMLRRPASLLLVGPLNPLEAAYYSRVLHDRERIFRTGTVPHARVLEYVRACDLMVFPSMAEGGLPNKILEAMLSGVPVIASRVHGILEGIENGVNGRLVEPRNPSALAAAIEEALKYPRMARGWALEASGQVRARYTLAAEEAAWREVYRAGGIL